MERVLWGLACGALWCTTVVALMGAWVTHVLAVGPAGPLGATAAVCGVAALAVSINRSTTRVLQLVRLAGGWHRPGPD